jgi:hypothetical protein
MRCTRPALICIIVGPWDSDAVGFGTSGHEPPTAPPETLRGRCVLPAFVLGPGDMDAMRECLCDGLNALEMMHHALGFHSLGMAAACKLLIDRIEAR